MSIFQTAALLILVAFYGFFFLKASALRSNGIKAERLGAAETKTAAQVEKMAKIASIVVPALEAASIIRNMTASPLPLQIAGLCVAVLGLAIFMLAAAAAEGGYSQNGSKDAREELVTEGIYQFCRNPAALGLDLTYAGIAMAFLNYILLVGSAFGIMVLHLHITNIEEPFLKAKFGKRYAAYADTVSRYLGRKR